ncbi:hypothetical protein [Flavobacterium hydatis]|uniref:Uncharacterized protein n=1 Tax=Flavobacterium hydatis TaxID=991 RepID=A0A086A5N5_FLAHY|nr:hypothetical protein [Flavobacterium hydatis]KFF11999.1 hypothetical protein IW20_18755 [Flavobacterium hydatis]
MNILEVLSGGYIAEYVGALIRYLIMNTINFFRKKDTVLLSKILVKKNSLVNLIIGGPVLLIVILMIIWLIDFIPLLF